MVVQRSWLNAKFSKRNLFDVFETFYFIFIRAIFSSRFCHADFFVPASQQDLQQDLYMYLRIEFRHVALL